MAKLEKTIPLATLWQKELALAFKRPKELLQFLGFSDTESNKFSHQAHRQFNLLLTQEYAKRISKQNFNDPLLKQVLPDLCEEELDENISTDAVGDVEAALNINLIQKYSNRALVVSSGACAIHCRYCFRRHYPYDQGEKSLEKWLEQFNPIGQNIQIEEVILSGGDPLMLSNEWLKALVKKINSFKNIKRLRIHSRIPLVLASRIDDDFFEIFEEFKSPKIMVWHVNHPNELDETTLKTAQKFQLNSWMQLNQNVLLRGINDDPLILKTLSDKLLTHSILPYYTHQLDEIQGVMHFKVPLEKGKDIFRELQRITSGYALPKYSQEIAKKDSKTLIPY